MIFRSELLNLNTETLNVSSAKVLEFAGATDLEEALEKKSGNLVLSFLKKHLVLSITAGIILLSGILMLVTIFFFYHKGTKVKNELKTWMTDLQIYNNYGPNVYKRVHLTTCEINDSTNGCLRYYYKDVYIDDFAYKVFVLKNIYNKAKSELSSNPIGSPQDIQNLQLMMLAAAKELKHISSEVMSATKYNFLKERIQDLLSAHWISYDYLLEILRIDFDGTFIYDKYCKYLVWSIYIELDAYQFMLNNNLQLLNNQVNESSTRIGILINLGPLNLLDIGGDRKYFVYESDFPVIEDIPMSNIKLGWNVFFKSGNEIFGYVEQRIHMLLLIRSRIINLLSPPQIVLDDRQLLENFLRQCEAESDFYLENSDFKLNPKMKSLCQNYVASNSGAWSYEGFIEYCQQQEIESVCQNYVASNSGAWSYEGFIEYCQEQTNDLDYESTTSREKNIRYNIIDTILNQKSGKPNLDNNNDSLIGTFHSSLKPLLSNKNLTEQLNFDPDDCERIKALFPPQVI